MRPAYWARTQSSLKRLATYNVTREKSSETFAAMGLIQVLNCCSGSSWASCSTHACHRLPPALSAPPAARLSLNPSLIRLPPLWIVVVRGTSHCKFSRRYPHRVFADARSPLHGLTDTRFLAGVR